MNLQTRIERLERLEQMNNDTDAELELYNLNGDKLENVKIIKMPQRFENGLAILPNGIEKEIICLCTMSDIIFGTEKYLDEIGRDNYKPNPDSVEKEYADKLFLRINGKISACETLFGNQKQKDEC